jgi:4-hydroxy-tetrahydrodipicolinate reductase
VRIHDVHHQHKRDAPSGTALALGQAVLSGSGGAAANLHYSSERTGAVVGEHEVRFVGASEQLSLKHVATDRAVFALGALRAGLWLVRQNPGNYRMADTLGEK